MDSSPQCFLCPDTLSSITGIWRNVQFENMIWSKKKKNKTHNTRVHQGCTASALTLCWEGAELTSTKGVEGGFYRLINPISEGRLSLELSCDAPNKNDNRRREEESKYGEKNQRHIRETDMFLKMRHFFRPDYRRWNKMWRKDFSVKKKTT